jgi:death on curing protein
LLESAIGRPFTGYYRAIHKKAAALVESLAKNHGFADGNKRTAFLIVDLFLYRSGYRLESRTDNVYVQLERFIVQIVRDRLSFDPIADWFAAHIVKRR